MLIAFSHTNLIVRHTITQFTHANAVIVCTGCSGKPGTHPKWRPFQSIPFPSNSGTVLSVIQNCMGSWEKGYVLCGFPWMIETSFISIWFEDVLSSLFLSSINCRLLICSTQPCYFSALKLNYLQSTNSLIVTYSDLQREMRMVMNCNKWFACLKEWKLLFTDTCT